MKLKNIQVSFSEGKIKPLSFIMGVREYKVERVTLMFERSDGGRKYLCFAVDTGGMVAELAWDLQEFSWRVAKCQPSYA